MPLELREVNTETDFPALAKCLYESYEEPPQEFFHAWFPIFGTDEKARKESLEEAATRLADWHSHDPSSYWQKVVDTETGNVAGGALWNIHPENPFTEPHDIEVTWFPDDGSRKFAEEMIQLHNAPRALLGQRPQVYLFIIFTHPNYRRKGVAQQFMSWGMKKADEMGVEMFLDATPVGKPLYGANGFVSVKENIIIPQIENPDQAWKEIAERIGPVPFDLMWRPAGGNYKEGKTIMPWNRN
ncbi:acyl-CoA N-acyltransferase [Hypoxylon sp. FL1857]|nr:acyl-CoA N-acyltransferase [Hypoxylon sp. FL1857]